MKYYDTKTRLLSAMATFVLLQPALVLGISYAREKNDVRALEAKSTAQSLRKQCTGLEYLTMIGIDNGHMCIFAKRTNYHQDIITPDLPHNDDSNKTNPCDSFRFHLLDPQTKVIDNNYDQSNFPDSNLYPLATRTADDLFDAFDNIHLSNMAYDVVTNNCATIVLSMMCSLKIEVTPQQIEWGANLLRDTPMLFLALQVNPNLGLLNLGSGFTMSSSTDDSMYSTMSRRLVEYYTEGYHCPHFDDTPAPPSEATSGYQMLIFLSSVTILVVLCSVIFFSERPSLG